MTVPVALEGRLGAAMAGAAAEVEAMLDRLLPQGEDAQSRLYRAMRYAALGGGKRIRAFLVLEAAALFNVARLCALRVAAAVEMLHAYSLVHDDLPAMDDDDLRRGKPSCHRAFDEATAILAGDALQALAFEVLAEPDTHSDPAVRCTLVATLGQAAGARGMAGGQMIDLLAENAPLTEHEVTRLQMLKTGRLITWCCEAGAILGKAPPQQRQALAHYGRDLGLAFQIADDILDETGTREQIGKTPRKDVAAGKATLVSLMGLSRAEAHMRFLADQATIHLLTFEDKADLLRDLVSYVITRRA
ncbi:polyprenyl synthetase family protein [Elioraea sp.]|jgi:farnesyl diphosphate synthase|uniref:polyprenyl synthetase family protein n=1 Tax=Elioraea sp. TaxID=2185103 RepID=UPI00307D1839